MRRKVWKQAGFTIVETMIVLAVMGGLFVMIAATMSGKQTKAQFQQSINTTQAFVQQTINEVATGYFPSLGNFGCTYNGSVLSFSAGATQQGANQDCVFLGKVIEFSTNPLPAAYTYTIAAARTGSINASGDPDDFYDAAARPVPYDKSGDSHVLKYGLTIHSMTANGTPIAAFGIFSTVGTIQNNQLVSGSPHLNIVAIKSTNLSDFQPDITNVQNRLNNPPVANKYTVNPTGGVKICFSDDAANESGLLTVGSDTSLTDTKLKTYSNTTCT